MSRGEATEASPSRNRPDLRAEGVKQRAKASTSCQRFLRSKGYDRARFGRVASRSGKDASLEEADLTAFVIIWGGDLSYANLFEQRDLKDQDLGAALRGGGARRVRPRGGGPQGANLESV